MRLPIWTVPFLSLPLLGLAGCQKTVGDTLRPEDRTAASASGAELECDAAPGRVKPLVVDWDPDARVDLEAAMQGSVVVVKYNCPNVEILPGCSVEGSYTYAGVSRKEQVIQMTNMDEVSANIPINSAKISAEISSGRAIDLATMLVGRRSTTVSSLSADALQGDCAGATHFVRSASLGAFSMATGSQGKAAVAAEVFGYGGGASSDSTRQALNSDGNVESCMSSQPSSPTPPAECQAPVRIEMMPLSTGKASNAAPGDPRSVLGAENSCMPGFVFSKGMCTRASDSAAYLCAPDDEAECKEQCDKGDAESCFNLGRMLTYGGSIERARPSLAKACKAGIGEACSVLGNALWEIADPEGNRASYDQAVNESYRFLSQGCNAGDAFGCEISGDIMATKKLPSFDLSAAFGFYSRSCALGSGSGCSYAAEYLMEGKGVSADVQRGVATLARSCEGGDFDVCGELGRLHLKGRDGLPKNAATAAKFLVRACPVEEGWCQLAGDAASATGDSATAKRMYKLDCDADPTSETCGRI